MSTRESYQVTGNTIEAVKTSLNRHLSRVADRLDKLEGLRGNLETQSGTFSGDVSVEDSDINVKDKDGITVHSMQ